MATRARILAAPALALLLAATALAAPAAAGKGGAKPSTSTNCKRNCDTTAPIVTIGAPSSGTVAPDQLTVTASASDASTISRIDVLVDGTAVHTVTGTASVSAPLSTTAWPVGEHAVAVVAIDASGNRGVASVVVTVEDDAPTTDPQPDPDPEPQPPGDGSVPPTFDASGADVVIRDPNATGSLLPVLRDHLLVRGTVTGVAYVDLLRRPAIFFRDRPTGRARIVPLPLDGTIGMHGASAVWLDDGDLLLAGGTGPITARRLRITWADGLPATATLTGSWTFGDGDSRPGDLVALPGGSAVLAWHQHGASGPQGLHVAHLASGSWTQLPPLTFMPTASSIQTMAVHPADGSIWLFSIADAWGQIGAARLVVDGDHVQVAAVDATFLAPASDGALAPDPELPYLVAVPDPSTGSIVLGYQSRERRTFSTSPHVVGSRVAVTRVGIDGTTTGTVAPTFAERVSQIGVAVRPSGETVISVHDIAADLTYDEPMVHSSTDAFAAGSSLGAAVSTAWSADGAETLVRTASGSLHLRSW